MTYCETLGYGTDNERKVFYKDKGSLILHREDGPAIEWKSGRKEWWVNGERHREDGEAVECLRNCGNHYFLRGVLYDKEDFFATVRLGNFI